MSAERVREFYRRQGEQRERERIIDLLIKADTTTLTDAEMGGWFFALRILARETQQINETKNMTVELYQTQNNAYYKAGVEDERERILKEIEEKLATTFNECPLGLHLYHWELERIVNNRSND
jgi:hypothetical protein